MKIRVEAKICILAVVAGLLMAPIKIVHASFAGYDGKVAFVDIEVINGEGSFSLTTMNQNGSSKQAIAALSVITGGINWSADGDRITYSDSDGENIQDVFIINADGTDKQRITNLSNDEGINHYSGGALVSTFSPDGTKIAYGKSFNGFDNPTCEIHVVNVDGTNDHNLTTDETSCEGAPVFSSDGSKIAFLKSNDAGTPDTNQDDLLEVYTMSPDGSNRQLISSFEQGEARGFLSSGEQVSLDWSPDGSKFLATQRIGNSFSESSLLIIPNMLGSTPVELKTASFTGGEGLGDITTYSSGKFTPSGDIIYTDTNVQFSNLGESFDFETVVVDGISTIKLIDVSGSPKSTIATVTKSNASFSGFYELYWFGLSHPAIQPLQSPPVIANESTFSSPQTNKPISLRTPEGTTITCSSASKESTQTKQDDSYQYPLGLVNFCFNTENQKNEVSLTFVTDLKPSDVKARKYNSTNQTYFDIQDASITETIVDGQHALKLTYTITDNGPLDLNPENGKITDPVGLATNGGLADTGQNQLPFYILATLLTLPAVMYIVRRKVSR